MVVCIFLTVKTVFVEYTLLWTFYLIFVRIKLLFLIVYLWESPPVLPLHASFLQHFVYHLTKFIIIIFFIAEFHINIFQFKMILCFALLTSAHFNLISTIFHNTISLYFTYKTILMHSKK